MELLNQIEPHNNQVIKELSEVVKIVVKLRIQLKDKNPPVNVKKQESESESDEEDVKEV